MIGEPDLKPLLDRCVQCGFCLPACPTYLLWGKEMDSPRGRIHLMKAVADGHTTVAGSFIDHMDACLGCMACVTACPSGVEYGALIESTRARIERVATRRLGDRLFRRLLFAILPYPDRLRLFEAPLVVFTRVRSLLGRWGVLSRLPPRIAALAGLAPPLDFDGRTPPCPERTDATGTCRLRVGLLTGCVQRIFFDDVNRATASTLAAEGCEVVAPVDQGCCGALSLHAGFDEQARMLGRRLIATFERTGVDRVVVNVAGCGSAMKDYGRLFAGDPEWAERARAFSERVRDVSEVLADLGLPRARRHPLEVRVAYHDACHLSHAQGVRDQPRAILAAIPGLTLLSIPEADICCGSAGIHNLVEPVAAAQLGDRKIDRIASVRPDLVATGNAGCLLQIAAAGRRTGRALPAFHPIQLVDASIRGTSVDALLNRDGQRQD